jgi:glycosyltransferase involved in cell wall biosynthesis
MASVSVILPHFNSILTLERAIMSVIKQTQPVCEIILIDDCSDSENDPTAICEKFKDQCKILLIKNSVNKGASYCRNLGIQKSTSDYLAFLDSDDVWHYDKIKIQMSVMLESKFTITAHSYIQDLNFHTFSNDVDKFKVSRIELYRFAIGNPVYTPTVMAIRLDFHLFDDRFRRVDDYKCWIHNYDKNFGYISTALAAGYKPAVGHSGLTASILLMHKSYIAVLLSLFHEKSISIVFLIASLLFEYLKLPLRLLIYLFRKIKLIR